LVVPALHRQTSVKASLTQSLLGIAVGAGVIYFVLRAGKLFFGKETQDLESGDKVVFGETMLHLPDREIPYGDLLYRGTDVIVLQAQTVELVDRCYKNVLVKLSRSELRIGEEVLDPERVSFLEATAAQITLPREAMGLGDVKFMGAIGAFLGWKAVLFSLVVSSFIGALVGIGLVVAGKRALSSRLPYGPYIALAAVVWMFAGRDLVNWYAALMAAWMGRG
jgi:leader peptidase (prepilin peptidase)/N-methyltransferase